MNCKKCNRKCIKWGKQLNGRQRFYCRKCKYAQQEHYIYNASAVDLNKSVIKLVCNGVSVRGMSRILEVSVNTIAKTIKQTAVGIRKPPIPKHRDCFEVDEIRTFIGCKQNQYWIAYALCSSTKQVVDFIVSKRTKQCMRILINTLLLSEVKLIKTDRLNIYQTLIPAHKHLSAAYNINHIERNNLNLRTHLKRLSRRTICYSKSKEMLEYCLRIYFWNPYTG